MLHSRMLTADVYMCVRVVLAKLFGLPIFLFVIACWFCWHHPRSFVAHNPSQQSDHPVICCVVSVSFPPDFVSLLYSSYTRFMAVNPPRRGRVRGGEVVYVAKDPLVKVYECYNYISYMAMQYAIRCASVLPSMVTHFWINFLASQTFLGKC